MKCVPTSMAGDCTTTGKGIRTKKKGLLPTSPNTLRLVAGVSYNCWILSYATADGSDTPACSGVLASPPPPSPSPPPPACVAEAVTDIKKLSPSVPQTTWRASWTTGTCNLNFNMKCVPTASGGDCTTTGAGVRTKDAANPATANSLYFLTPDTDYTCYVLSYATPDASDTPVCSDPVSVITPPCTQDSVTAATDVTTVVDGPNDPATTWTATWKSGVCNNAFLMKCVPKSLGEDCTSTAQGVRTQDVNTTITRALYLLDPGSDYYCYVLSYYTTDYSSPPVCSASILHTTTAGPPGR